jgi:transcriptional regulator with XRE-family HTH domain
MGKSAKLFAKAIHHFLEMRELSQSDLAEKIGQSPQVINRYANASSDNRISAIDKVADALGIQPHELLIDHQAKPESESIELLEAIRLLKNLDPVRLDVVLRLLKSFQPVPGLLSKKE